MCLSPEVTVLSASFRSYYCTLKAVCVLLFSGINFFDTWDSMLVRTSLVTGIQLQQQLDSSDPLRQSATPTLLNICTTALA